MDSSYADLMYLFSWTSNVFLIVEYVRLEVFV